MSLQLPYSSLPLEWVEWLHIWLAHSFETCVLAQSQLHYAVSCLR